MKITKITQSKKIADRYTISFEDGTELKANVALIADYSLYTGRDLDSEELEALKQSAGQVAAKSRALKMINARAMSKAELCEKLVLKGESEHNAAMAAEWLEQLGFLNDGEYANMLVRHYAAKGYGTGKIKNELYRRKVPKEHWEEALAHMPESDEMIDRFIAAKLKGAVPEKSELKKVSDALLRRGFSWDEIKSALVRYNNTIEEND